MLSPDWYLENALKVAEAYARLGRPDSIGCFREALLSGDEQDRRRIIVDALTDLNMERESRSEPKSK